MSVASNLYTVPDVFVLGDCLQGVRDQILTKESVNFLRELHIRFNNRRLTLLKEREVTQSYLSRGIVPPVSNDFAHVRSDRSWRVAPVPSDLMKRHIELTGPVDRKQIISALNSGADCYMADFEDASAPSWSVMVNGQLNLRDANNGSITVTNPDGSIRRLNPSTATLMVRPRGWHLNERHVVINGAELSASLFDFGLYFFLNAPYLHKLNRGCRFYLPKLESALEAKLWSDVFAFSCSYLNVPLDSIRATVLVETIGGSLQMEEIVYALRHNLAGLNAGRWDYLFSCIKKFPNRILPDRSELTMKVPFMTAYCEKLVLVCHRRGVHAIGGMAADVPSKSDEAARQKCFAAVVEDKTRELNLGFDGTWVAHPALVKVVRDLYNSTLNKDLHQKDKTFVPKVYIDEDDSILLNFIEGLPTANGIYLNIRAAILYVAAWISNRGAVAIDNKMEDAATAEVSRAQLWQWLHRGVTLKDKPEVVFTKNYYSAVRAQVLIDEKNSYPTHILLKAASVLDACIFVDKCPEFITLLAYPQLLLEQEKEKAERQQQHSKL